jgi:FtsP/CotA-like multicopper oxidase with cupredoxin domain
MRKSFVAAVSGVALIGAIFAPTAAATNGLSSVTGVRSVNALSSVGGTATASTSANAAVTKDGPVPDLAARMKKAKKDRENLVTDAERLRAAKKSGIKVPVISRAQLNAFDKVQSALAGTGGKGTKGTNKAAVDSSPVPDAAKTPHYFGPYANYANSPQHLPAAIVDFGKPVAPGGIQAMGSAILNAAGAITGVTVTTPGTGYASAPSVTFTGPGAGASATATLGGSIASLSIANPGNGYNDPVDVAISAPPAGGTQATATATINPISGAITAVTLTNAGTGYTATPTITVTDGVGGFLPSAGGVPADVTANMVTDGVGAVTINTQGSGYLLPGIKKFQDSLPGLTAAGANNLGQYIPVAVADTTTYPGSDYYEIAVVQYREQMSSSLPKAGTLLRGYVQLSTTVVPGLHIPLTNALMDGTTTPVLLPDGSQAYGVDKPHYLGPVIAAEKDHPTRVLFRDLLPTGVAGDLFLPVDTTVMGAGAGPAVPAAIANMGLGADTVNPDCGKTPKPTWCYSENRATLHLHGGATPWISDGTPHQWITPAGDPAAIEYPKGVSVKNVPDMVDPGPGAQTFFYTNQQSARLMFYHDHSWGITRLNVYAGEAAGYVITDATEKRLVSTGVLPDGLSTIPLIIEDKTFVPSKAELSISDPTWDVAKWGGNNAAGAPDGNLWMPHVYMTAQNPQDSTGVNQFGRWAYGPWFWPPTTGILYPTIPNPWAPANNAAGTPLDPKVNTGAAGCIADMCDPAAWKVIPGVPNESMGMEAFNDTPVVNGTAYPTLKVDAKSYRFRILNAANDRFWNLSLYQASGTTCVQRTGAGCTEVALDPVAVAAAKIDPTIVPAPAAAAGPSFLQVGNEGGFLANPVSIPAQPITWVTDPTVFNAGNVDKHSLLLGPAARADTVVDFSKFAGQTLILYNDAPAAFPARDARYDYYTNNADMRSTGGANTTPEGYGPNTRTVMQIVVSSATAPAFNVTRVNREFASTTLGGGGVFEKSQHPIVVGQAAYNRAYNETFGGAGNPDGFARITDSTLTFETLPDPKTGKNSIITMMDMGGQAVDSKGNPVVDAAGKPVYMGKAMHDEMGASWDNLYGRMSSTLGLEKPNNKPGQLQNLVLTPYINPSTENFKGLDLPQGIGAVPVITMNDGTQIWKITHNGVDTHPIHFHFSDVQLINRVGWDGIIRQPDANEIGWKDTVRISPLEDTIVAIRPIVPQTPFGIDRSIRPLNPSQPTGPLQTDGFVQVAWNGDPLVGAALITNQLTDFGWEYVWHCHILSHEEMDMMHPISVDVTTIKPDASVLSYTAPVAPALYGTLNWTDPTPASLATTWGDPKNEVGYRILRTSDITNGVVNSWATVTDANGVVTQGEIATALANQTTWVDKTAVAGTQYAYKVVSWNATKPVGTTDSNIVMTGAPAATITLTGTATNPNLVSLNWTVAGGTPTNYLVQSSADQVTWATVAQTTGPTQALTAQPVGPMFYRVAGVIDATTTVFSNALPLAVPGLAKPTITAITPASGLLAGGTSVTITGTGLFDAAGTTTVKFGATAATLDPAPPVANSATSITVITPAGAAGAVDVAVTSPSGSVTKVGGFTYVNATLPDAPINVAALSGWNATTVAWVAPANTGGIPITGYTATAWSAPAVAAGTCTTASTTCTITGLVNGTSYSVDVYATNAVGNGPPSTPQRVVLVGTKTAPVMPTPVTATAGSSRATVTWTLPVSDGGSPITAYRVQQSVNGSTAWTTVANNVGPAMAAGVQSLTITRLTPGTSYQFRVAAINAIGVGPWAQTAAAVVPFTVPVAVGTVTANTTPAVLRTVVLSWAAVVSISPITSYRVQMSIDGVTWNGVGNGAATALTSRTVTGLTSGTVYQFRVAARNAAGTGPYSAPVTVTAP